MNRNDARGLARLLLQPLGALCELVTRGPAWPPAEECREYKRAVGNVLGNAYLLLKPIWQDHPDLDPGSASNTDPLGFRDQDRPVETSPEGMLPYLEQADSVLQSVVTRMVADPAIGKYRDFIEASAIDLEEAIVQAKQLFAQTGSQR
jgi:hypothetical protein